MNNLQKLENIYRKNIDDITSDDLEWYYSFLYWSEYVSMYIPDEIEETIEKLMDTYFTSYENLRKIFLKDEKWYIYRKNFHNISYEQKSAKANEIANELIDEMNNRGYNFDNVEIDISEEE